MATAIKKLYVDSSCFPPLFTIETATNRAEAFFNAPPRNTLMAVSPWTMTEFHSAIAQKVRAKIISVDERAKVLTRFGEVMREHFEAWAVQESDFHDASLLMSVWSLKLRASDALHLAIARRHHATLVSLDDALIGAAKYYRIPTLSF